MKSSSENLDHTSTRSAVTTDEVNDAVIPRPTTKVGNTMTKERSLAVLDAAVEPEGERAVAGGADVRVPAVTTSKIRNSIIQAARLAVGNLRSTADRLERAADRADFESLAEISLSFTMWPVDQIRGAATVIARLDCAPSTCPRCGRPAHFRYANADEAARQSPLCWGESESNCPGMTATRPTQKEG
jgi:hypothetical protein